MEPAGQQTQQAARPREDWFDEDFVTFWIDQQDARMAERRRQFLLIRALVPKLAEDTFRYINLGAGPGHLDEMLLEAYPHAEALLVDGSLAMLAEARRRLERFEGRAEFVQADLGSPDWVGAVQGPFDVAVSTIALHNLRDPRRIRALYAELYPLIGHGGMFLNLDYVRLAHPSLAALATKASQDPDAGLGAARGGGTNPGTVEEQLGWIREAGFPVAECFWREFRTALFGGVHDHLHLPGADDAHGAAHAHEAADDHGHEHHDHGHEEAHAHHGHEEHGAHAAH